MYLQRILLNRRHKKENKSITHPQTTIKTYAFLIQLIQLTFLRTTS